MAKSRVTSRAIKRTQSAKSIKIDLPQGPTSLKLRGLGLKVLESSIKTTLSQTSDKWVVESTEIREFQTKPGLKPTEVYISGFMIIKVTKK